ncbi:putative pertactin family virulence factor/autotransporter [Yersinia enterocolitica]|nr:putative pertactin family virulence factor/autotransporter [Yersinia enterocolitica]
MLNSTTLNTRLLPLSILISSLVSGSAIAVPAEDTPKEPIMAPFFFLLNQDLLVVKVIQFSLNSIES